jgi:hypothetical protein
MAELTSSCPCQRSKEKAPIVNRQTSADNGCPRCRAIWESIEHFAQIEADARTSLFSNSYVQLERDYIQVHREGHHVGLLWLISPGRSMCPQARCASTPAAPPWFWASVKRLLAPRAPAPEYENYRQSHPS